MSRTSRGESRADRRGRRTPTHREECVGLRERPPRDAGKRRWRGRCPRRPGQRTGGQWPRGRATARGRYRGSGCGWGWWSDATWQICFCSVGHPCDASGPSAVDRRPRRCARCTGGPRLGVFRVGAVDGAVVQPPKSPQAPQTLNGGQQVHEPFPQVRGISQRQSTVIARAGRVPAYSPTRPRATRLTAGVQCQQWRTPLGHRPRERARVLWMRLCSKVRHGRCRWPPYLLPPGGVEQ